MSSSCFLRGMFPPNSTFRKEAEFVLEDWWDNAFQAHEVVLENTTEIMECIGGIKKEYLVPKS